jgi:UDP-N-acetylglucosamine 4,6-dehydratase
MFDKINKIILPSWLIFNIDIVLSFFSILLSYLLRFNFRIPDFYASSLSIVIGFVVIIRAISFLIAGTHKVTIRHISVSDFFVLTIVVFSGSSVLLLMNFFYYYFIGHINLIPLSIVLIDFFIATYLFFIVGSLPSSFSCR